MNGASDHTASYSDKILCGARGATAAIGQSDLRPRRGALFAQGRRTVASWLRAAGLGADFRKTLPRGLQQPLTASSSIRAAARRYDWTIKIHCNMRLEYDLRPTAQRTAKHSCIFQMTVFA